MIGQKLSPILEELETLLLEFEVYNGCKPNYTIEGFRAATKIFMSVMMDKMWELQANEKITMEDRVKMAEKLGKEIRQLVKIYTDIDTLKLYNQ